MTASVASIEAHVATAATLGRSTLARFGERVLVIHRSSGYEPVKLPFPRKKLPLATLHQVFGPRLGPRFRIDPEVAAQG